MFFLRAGWGEGRNVGMSRRKDVLASMPRRHCDIAPDAWRMDVAYPDDSMREKSSDVISLVHLKTR